VSDWLSVAPLAWMVVAPVLAALVRVSRRPSERMPVANVLAGVLFPVALAAGFIAAEIILPP
jgi:hypothetical protein